MIKKLSSLKKAVKGQTIKDLAVSYDHSTIMITFEGGGTLTVSGKLMDSISVPMTLILELRNA